LTFFLSEGLFDPHMPKTSSLPKDERNFAIYANNAAGVASRFVRTFAMALGRAVSSALCFGHERSRIHCDFDAAPRTRRGHYGSEAKELAVSLKSKAERSSNWTNGKPIR
jgi:hypothetical protein